MYRQLSVTSPRLLLGSGNRNCAPESWQRRSHLSQVSRQCDQYVLRVQCPFLSIHEQSRFLLRLRLLKEILNGESIQSSEEGLSKGAAVGFTGAAVGFTGGAVGLTGAEVGLTGALVGFTGAGVGSTGALVGFTGAGVGLTGAGVGSTGALVGFTGAGVGSTGAAVGLGWEVGALVNPTAFVLGEHSQTPPVFGSTTSSKVSIPISEWVRR